MSTRDKLYGILDTLDDDQLESLFRFLSNIIPVKNTDREANEDEIDKLMGIFHDAADPNKIPFEKTAWETAAAEKHLHFLEDIKNENS